MNRLFILKMSDSVRSPKVHRKDTRTASLRGSSEPKSLFSDPIVISANTKGKALAGSKGVDVLAKRSALHTVSLLSGRVSTSSAAGTSGSSQQTATTGKSLSLPEGASTSAKAASRKKGQSSGSNVPTRTLTAPAVSEFRSAAGSLTRTPDKSGNGKQLSGDPPSAPPSSADTLVPGQGDRIRIHADASPPVTPSDASGSRLDRLEAMFLQFMEEHGRVSGSGSTSSGSGVTHSGPGVSGSRVDNTGSGSGITGSGSGSGSASSGSGVTHSGPGVSGSWVDNTGSGSGITGSGSGSARPQGLSSSVSGDVASETMVSGIHSSGSGVVQTRPPTGSARTSGYAVATASGLADVQATSTDDQINVDSGSEEEVLQPDLSPPVLTRDRETPVYLWSRPGPSYEESDLGEDGTTQSEAALLFAGLAGVASVNRKYVTESAVPKRPGCLGSATSGAARSRYTPSGIVSSWCDFHWNVLRGARDLGADSWAPELRSVSLWQPSNTNLLPVVKRLFRPQAPLVLDPALPVPACPSEEERALVPPSQRSAKGSVVPETKVLSMEQRMHTAAEALDVASTITSALAEAILHPEDKDQLHPDPNADSVVTILSALPAALSYAANALSAAMICGQLSRRDAILEKANLPKSTSAKLRLVPPVTGSLFGTHLESVRVSTETRTPLCVEELARVLQASGSTKPAKPALPASGWGSKRKRHWNQPAAGAPPSKKGKRGTGSRPPQPKGKGKGRKGN